LETVSKIRIILGLLLLITGIFLIIIGRKKRKYWETTSKYRINHAVKKIKTETDLKKLDEICRSARQKEIREYAEDRKFEILYQYLESGDNIDAVISAVKSIIQNGMYDNKKTDFLAAAAKKRPEIIQDFWPDLQKWAHQDSKSHTDNNPGMHTDRTEYYDYFRYPDGRTVPNRSGRKRHTDTRISYSDCHDDKHGDSTVHTDSPHNEKLVRFKPYIPKE
ncbi:MAG: hypothetical protein GX633_02320, partial [Clostridiales bacterium]|nr:hypothetical protein [Clostridiales bacterium]